MGQAIEIVLGGLVVGAIYALVAIGFTLVYRVAGVLNLAQGAFVVLGALVFYTLEVGVGWPLPLAIAGAVVLVAAVGAAVEWLAVDRARRKAKARGLDIDLRRADVTQLAGAGVDGPFDLVFDLGCFHGLRPETRERYAAEVARVSRDDATFLLFAFSSAPFARGGPKGVPRETVERLFDRAFELVEARPGTGPGAPFWYTMRRR